MAGARAPLRPSPEPGTRGHRPASTGRTGAPEYGTAASRPHRPREAPLDVPAQFVEGSAMAYSAARKRTVLITLCTGLFMAMLDNLVVTTALPSIGTALRSGTSGLQWVVEAYSVVFAALLLTGGTLGDRYGRRRVYLAGLALFTAGSALCALAQDVEVLIAGRAVQGIGAAALTPGTLAILRHVFTEPGERARAIGVNSGVSGAGLAIGPVLGGPLVDNFGWASAFWINVPVGIAGLIVAARVLPEVPRSTAKPDLAGQITAVTGLAALVLTLIEGPVHGWTHPLVLGGLAVSVVALAAFVALELRVGAPMLDLRLLTSRTTGTAALSGFTVGFGFFGLTVFLTMYLQYVLGWSATSAGLAMLPATVFTGLTAFLTGRICARFGSRLPLAGGLLLLGTGLAGLTFHGADAAFAEFGWLMPVLGTGFGMTVAATSITVLEGAPPERAGMASATVNMLREVGGVAGVAVMGAVLTARFAAVLRGELPAGGPAADGVAHSVTAGGGTGLGSTGALPARLERAVEESFVAGLHLALWVGAGALLATAALVLLRMRGPRHEFGTERPATARQERRTAA
ncbi:MFS transporter [Streptomyces daqingensis]|uniref:MFS transporter n=1 Tax=Streptomyces daqingensis TaxID=1472640 RepID=UPI001E3B069E|nr:MFS transporter [Streptomyces daqingensis]